MIKLDNGVLSVSVEEVGAQIRSIFSERSRREYLWCADADIWNRSAPILFPVVGRVYTDGYIYNGKRFSMPKHGFLREAEFSVSEQSDTSLVLSYSSCERTRALYPFDFVFKVAFSLSGKTLCVTYTVENTGNDAMYFSVGAHPGFACEFGDKVVFERAEKKELPYFDGNDRPSGAEKYVMPSGEREIELTKTLFEKGTIVLNEPNSETLSLFREEREYLRFDFGKVPHLWLWAKPGAKFVCIEPWHGADECVPREELSEKVGIITLPAGEKFVFPTSVTVFE